MTRHGKCDICRKRKVKCDEVRPACGTCTRGYWQCSYSPTTRARPVKQTRFITVQIGARMGKADYLRDGERDTSPPTGRQSTEAIKTILALRSATTASSGLGMYHTFRPIFAELPEEEGQTAKANSSFVIRQPSLATDSLTLRWREMIHGIAPGDAQPYLVGEWQEAVPQRIGHNKTVDLAIDCLVSSAVARMNYTRQNVTRTMALNAEALAGVRRMLAKGNLTKIQDDVLLAVSFLWCAEVFNGVGTDDHKVHMRGQHELIVHVSKQGKKSSSLCRQMFFTHAHSNVMPSVLARKDSIFDTPAWLSTSSPKVTGADYPDAEKVEEYLAKGFIRIPRLVRLVRTAREELDAGPYLSEALSLADDLYSNTLENWVQEAKNQELFSETPTTSPDCIPAVATSFHFASTQLFKRLIQYWQLRCYITSSILALHRTCLMKSHPSPFHVAAVLEHEIQAAECITMSVQWVRSSPLRLPIYEVRIVPPLMIAFGVWFRMELRATTAEGAQRAKLMQVWSAEMVTAIGGKLNGNQVPIQRLRAMSGILMGQPFPNRDGMKSAKS